VHVRERAPDGAILRETSVATDKFTAEGRRGIEADDALGSAWLLPNQARRLSLRGPFGTPPEIMPEALVFADRTQAGNGRIVADVFQRTANGVDVMRNLLPQLRGIRQALSSAGRSDATG
jgi:hypothetical protein